MILSLGLGIFFNNALTVMIIPLSPIPILRAEQFSDEHLAKLYYEHGIWLFKPMGWRIYRALSLILPIYALGLQFYLIGGVLALHTPDAGTMIFLAIEAAANIILLRARTSTRPLQKPSPASQRLHQSA
ncbi:MAG: hypothetical protein QXU12_03620 [Nitrososphaerota archaeon]